METPILQTKRLVLRPLELSDASGCLEGWTSDPRVTKFMIWTRHNSLADTKAWLEEEVAARKGSDNYTWGMVKKEGGALIGSGGFHYQREMGLYEIGYVLSYDYWGKGYTTEAAQAMVEFAQKTLGVTTLWGRHAVDNPASGKVMEHVGFRFWKMGTYTTLDGRKFESKEYLWHATVI